MSDSPFSLASFGLNVPDHDEFVGLRSVFDVLDNDIFNELKIRLDRLEKKVDQIQEQIIRNKYDGLIVVPTKIKGENWKYGEGKFLVLDDK